MSFIDTLKRAFGFSTRGEEVEDEDYDYTSIGYAVNNRTTRDNVDTQPKSSPVTASVVADRDEGVSPANEGGLHDEYVRLKAAFDKVTAERDRYKHDKLSAERQKQALTDRVYDLEHKLTDTEQEKEKLYADNKRLEVQVKRMQAKTPAAAAEDGSAGVTSVADTEAEMLQAELDNRDRQIEKLNAAVTEHKRMAAGLKHDMETLEVKSRMAETMVTDLQSAASSSARLLQQSQAELEATRKELEEANANLELAAKAVAKVERLQDFKYKQDLRIAELKRSVEMREKEIRSLNSTIEHNLRRHAENEALMREEIKQLRSGIIAKESGSTATAVTDDAIVEPRKRRHRGKGERRGGDNRSDDPGQMSLFS